jgi:OOP family OmpA-OmpF porin
MNLKGKSGMTQVRKAALALVGALTLAAPSIGMAQGMSKALTGPDSGWYVGGGIGQSKIDIDTTGLDPATTIDDKDTSFRVFGGYQINRHFAVELGYSQLGELSGNEPGFGSFTSEAKAWDLVAVGILPVADKFSLLGKVGMYKADVDFSAPAAGESMSDSNSDLTYGIGVQYDFSKNLGLRAEWQQYKKVGGSDVGESDVDVMGISVLWRFK